MSQKVDCTATQFFDIEAWKDLGNNELESVVAGNQQMFRDMQDENVAGECLKKNKVRKREHEELVQSIHQRTVCCSL